MATWRLPYAGEVSDAFRQYGQESVGPLERALSRAFYADALGIVAEGGADAALVRELLAREVDVLNLSSVLRMNASGDGHLGDGNASELIAGGARLSPSFLSSLVDLGDVSNVVGRLASTTFYPVA